MRCLHACSCSAACPAAHLPPGDRVPPRAAHHLPTPRRAAPHGAGVAAALPAAGGGRPGPRLRGPGGGAVAPGRRSAPAAPGPSHLGGRAHSGRTGLPASPGRRPAQHPHAGTVVSPLSPPARTGRPPAPDAPSAGPAAARCLGDGRRRAETARHAGPGFLAALRR